MSVPPRQLYSASEIGKMNLPGLPKSKGRVIDRAKAEGWQFEERKDVGGVRRMYEIPEKYLAGTSYSEPVVLQAVTQVAGTVAGGSNRVDTGKLELAITALAGWEQKRNIQITPERRSAVIALLYEYLETHSEEGPEAMERVLRALG